MSEKRFKSTLDEDTMSIMPYLVSDNEECFYNLEGCVDLLNELHEENMDLRAKHTQMIIIMKDVVRDLKRMDTYRYAEHLEKIANLHFFK